jgi:hypothetical protein
LWAFKKPKKKEILTSSFLDSINKNFAWKYIPTKGTVGGILVGVR